jgi:hypothetical protein
MAEAGFNTTSRRRIVMSGNVVGTLSTGDGQILFPVPVGVAHIAAIVWGLDAGGGTSGSTGLMINRVRAETDVEMTSAASEIANDASTLYATIRGTLQNNILVLGDIVRVDVDEVPTGAAGLAVALILHVDAD